MANKRKVMKDNAYHIVRSIISEAYYTSFLGS